MLRKYIFGTLHKNFKTKVIRRFSVKKLHINDYLMVEPENLYNTNVLLKEKIFLTEKEKEIFQIFTTFVKEANLNTVLRVAGGWVRDKLLGLESSDIDITLDNMSGEEFVKLAYEYMNKSVESGVHGFGVTKYNPDKSKHLETAKINLKDVWIDVVNLRGEIYEDNSRIPKIVIGTPKQDAERRDLTINSMFYNLMTEEVEDLTAKGIEDLKNGIIRTPLDPTITFRDDPLRILRTFRFASRFNYRMVPEIMQAATKPDIIDILKNKVSKERIGIELGLVLNNKNAFKALTYYQECGILPVVLEVPSALCDISDYEKNKKLTDQAFKLCDLVNKYYNKVQEFKVIKEDFDEAKIRYHVYLAALLLPYRDQKIKKNKSANSLICYIVKESLKFTSKDGEISENICMNLEKIPNFLKDLEIEPELQIMKETKRWIKDNGVFWEITFFLKYLLEIARMNSEKCSAQAIDDGFKRYQDFIYKHKYEKLFKIKPIINGDQIKSLFNLKPGPDIKRIHENVFFWQLDNLHLDEKQILEYIGKNKQEFMS